MIYTEEKQIYASPVVKTVEAGARAVLCLSGGINNMDVDPDGGENFE